MNRHPSISVVMPVYNTGKYVGEAIQGILMQSLTDFEFIIVNDGSTDNSLDIIRSFKDNRIKIINKRVVRLKIS
jgi:glycosyltransferase involved in cell wall biosynthesis